jgi:hypothetical protein
MAQSSCDFKSFHEATFSTRPIDGASRSNRKSQTQMFKKRWTEDNPCPTGVQEEGGWLNIVHYGGDEHVIPKDLDPDRGLGRRTGGRR